MLKSILFFIFFSISLKYNFAQSYAASNSIASSTTGGSSYASTLIIDWNIGQVFTKAFTDQANLLLTTGFIQSKDFSKIIDLNLDSLIKLDQQYNLISIYPNPTSNFLFILNSENRIKIVQLNLMNIKGEIIKRFDAPHSTPGFNKKISLSNIANGTYILCINYIIDNKQYKAKYLKIIKI